MNEFIEQSHNTKKPITKYHNRIDLDTQLKRQGLSGLYGKSEQAEEQRELHKHLIKRALLVGEKQAKYEAIKGKMFNREDINKI